MPATQQMQMQMIHRLPTIVSGVHDDPVAFAQLLVACDRTGSRHQRTQQPCISLDCARRRSDVALRNNQHVCRRLGIDVRKPNAKLVFIDAVRWNIPADDPAEEAIGRW